MRWSDIRMTRLCCALMALTLAMAPSGQAAAGKRCLAAPDAVGAVAADGAAVVEDWPQVINECLAPLEQPFGGRWPLVLWEIGPPEHWNSLALQQAAARGVVPAIRIELRYLDLARRLQALKLPVIVVEGRGGDTAWPYGPATPDDQDWAFQLPADREVPMRWRRQPVPTLLDGWARAADDLRQRLDPFVAAGIRIDAFWMDYETQPATLELEAVKSATGGAAHFPPGVTEDTESFNRYRRQLWLNLISAYVAAPIREAYPDAAVTNWIATVSLPDNPVLSWSGKQHAPSVATLLTHTNPVAYGVDLGLVALMDAASAYSPDDIDWLYLHLLLRQVSADAENRQRAAPYLGSVAWVARWVAELPGHPAPVMSRSAYREALRHLWLRDLDAMAVFNPRRPGFARMQLAEVQDAAQVYREMLPDKQLLTAGRALNFASPDATRPGLIWSGVADTDGALIRIFNPGAAEREISIRPWTGVSLVLVAPPGGISYRLRRGPQGALGAETRRYD